MAASSAFSLSLPEGHRLADVLAFHRRDALEVAERVGPASLHKGLIWAELPACLTLRFEPGAVHAELDVDGVVAEDPTEPLKAMVGRMLGLSQDVDAFERRFKDHPQLGPVIARQAGLRVPQSATPFEALTWAVTGQQITIGAAITLRRQLILATGLRHRSGLHAHPGAAQLATLPLADWRRAGFSNAKAQALITMSQRVLTGQCPLDDWLRTLPVDELRQQLMAVRGIGPWTVNYALLRGFGWLDGSLHGDAAVRRRLQAVLGSADKVSEAQARDWLAQFAPWRALAAAHLWANQA